MRIITNNKPRAIICGLDLSAKERAEFDYYSEDELDNAFFVRYKGQVYDIGEFMRIDKSVAPHPHREGWANWHGYASDSFFSGVLIRYADEYCDHVVMGRYYE